LEVLLRLLAEVVPHAVVAGDGDRERATVRLRYDCLDRLRVRVAAEQELNERGVAVPRDGSSGRAQVAAEVVRLAGRADLADEIRDERPVLRRVDTVPSRADDDDVAHVALRLGGTRWERLHERV